MARVRATSPIRIRLCEIDGNDFLHAIDTVGEARKISLLVYRYAFIVEYWAPYHEVVSETEFRFFSCRIRIGIWLYWS